jgi:putative phage-type endonuclease
MKNPPPNYVEVLQHSAEWLTLRRASVTASRVYDVVHKLKNGKYSKERQNYLYEKLTEVLTGRAAEHYVSPAMDFGSEHEGMAREVYQMETGLEVEKVGYFKHPVIPRSGASPDAVVGDDGLVELKVPNTETHFEYLFGKEVPEQYVAQMMWQMACTGRAWCDFCSFDPRLPSDCWLFIKRIPRDEARIAEMEAEVIKFIAELNEMCVKLQARAPKAPAGPGPERAEMPPDVLLKR